MPSGVTPQMHDIRRRGWNSSQSSGSLDVAAHEMTHGVTSATSTYLSGNPGTEWSNVGYIWHCSRIYAYANGANTTPGYWLVRMYGLQNSRRCSPVYGIIPRKMPCIDTYANYSNGLNVHLSSGIANNAFYLLSVGWHPPVGWNSHGNRPWESWTSSIAHWQFIWPWWKFLQRAYTYCSSCRGFEIK